MSFLTIGFLVFFLTVWGLSLLFRPYKEIYKVFIIVSNFVFYSFFGLSATIFLATDIVVNFGLLKLLEVKNQSKAVLQISVAINLIFLIFYKNFNNLNDLLTGNRLGFPGMDIIAPIGISFFTFKIISVLVDTFRHKIRVKNFVDYVAYVSFFPQISAGPISRYDKFDEDINSKIEIDYSKFWSLLISGWLKMYLIAGALFEVVNQTINLPQSFGQADLILGMLSISFFIYANFSGYSDISQALAMVLGFRTLENFNSPYRSVSIRDFWQRWHISLSSWLRDYLYIPLGGNRKGIIGKYSNLFITMIIGGIWHGVGFSFFVWGGFQGILLIISHFFDDFVWTRFAKASNWLKFIGRMLGWFVTFGLINISWIIFYPKNMETSVMYFKYLITSTNIQPTLWSSYIIIILILVAILSIFGEWYTKIASKILGDCPIILRYFVLIGIFYLIIVFGPSNYVAPTAYFNF